MGSSILRLLVAMAIAPATATAIDVTQCAQVVPAYETGVLQTDLTCLTEGFCGYGASPGLPCSVPSDCYDGECNATGVVLRPGAVLQLNGHTITGPYPGGGSEPVGVVCAPIPTCAAGSRDPARSQRSCMPSSTNRARSSAA